MNGEFTLRNDVYKTVSQDGRHWTYRYMPSGFVFKAERVDDKFKLTSCEGGQLAFRCRRYFVPTIATRSMLVVPVTPKGTPPVITTRSPVAAKPSSRA